MITPDIVVPNPLTNPLDDLIVLTLGLIGFLRTERGQRSLFSLVLYVTPLLLRYGKYYYKSGHMHDKLVHLEYEMYLLRQSFKEQKKRKIG